MNIYQVKIRSPSSVSIDVHVGGSFFTICEMLTSSLGEGSHMERDNQDTRVSQVTQFWEMIKYNKF